MDPQDRLNDAERLSSETISWPAEPKLAAVLEEYMGLCREGRRPSRAAFLEEHASLGPALAECLDGLDYLETAASSVSEHGEAPADVPLAPRTVLGDYRILREVGRGGMGVVYEAQQVSLVRRVALKVLPLGAGLDPRQRQRFQVEAQAAAHLQHPRIVPIYSVGCDQGVHFYAMQFIEGRSLADVIRDRADRKLVGAVDPWTLRAEAFGADPTVVLSPHGTNGTETNGGPRPRPEGRPAGSNANGSGLSSGPSAQGREFARNAARLGMQAAEALDHAHGLGIVHRDIKPSNLLIDARGDLWVTDFGLARMQDDVGQTRTGDLVGTLRYMSPEQAAGGLVPLDHRTDVYSLGATLYELLTSRPAFDGQTRPELLRQIAIEEPVAVRRIDPTIPRDLETIVMKAMAKEAERRYPTAQSLADDLDRFIEDRPILARRPNAVERTARWARRHATLVTTAIVILIMAAVVGGALLWSEKQRTENALAQMKAEKEKAEKALEEAKASVHVATGIARYIECTLDQPLHDYVKMYDYVQKNTPELTGNPKDALLRAALTLYDAIARDSAKNPRQRSLAALAHHQIGCIRRALRIPGDEAEFRTAIRLLEEDVAAAPDKAAARLAIAKNLAHEATTKVPPYAAYSGPWPASECYKRAVEIEEDVLLHHRTELESVFALIEHRESYIGCLRAARRNDEADAVRRKGEVWNAQFISGNRDDPVRLGQIANTYYGLAAGNLQNGPLYREVASRYYRLALTFDPRHVQALNDEAWLLGSLPDLSPHDPATALEYARRAVEIAPNEGNLVNTLGVIQYRAGDWRGAAETLERSMRLRNGGDPSDWIVLAMARYRLGDIVEARRLLDKASRWTAPRNGWFPEFGPFLSEALRLMNPAIASATGAPAPKESVPTTPPQAADGAARP